MWWGCEFTDDGGYGVSPPPQIDAIWLPIELVRSWADPKILLETLRSDRVGLEKLASRIRSEGIKVPGEVRIGKDRVRLHDGYHRLIVLDWLGYTRYPARIVQCNILNGIQLQRAFADLLGETYGA